jgi:hypothetical protein
MVIYIFSTFIHCYDPICFLASRSLTVYIQFTRSSEGYSPLDNVQITTRICFNQSIILPLIRGKSVSFVDQVHLIQPSYSNRTLQLRCFPLHHSLPPWAAPAGVGSAAFADSIIFTYRYSGWPMSTMPTIGLLAGDAQVLCIFCILLLS